MRRRFPILLLLAALASATPAAAQTLGDIARNAQAARTGVFGSMEFPAASVAALPQWGRVLQKMQAERGRLAACSADAGKCGSAALKSWRRVIAAAAGKPRRQQIEEINRYFNQWPYKLDQEVYGVSEYWATPTEFMTNSGDCEDYAIAKFYALRELGLANDSMRVVALIDRIRGIGHAILAVYVDGDILILDNLTDFIFPHTRYTHYEPQYSVNETTRWAHIVQRDPLGSAPR